MASIAYWTTAYWLLLQDCKIYLCGTKKDISDADSKLRQVDIHDATDFADEVQAEIFETSSKTGENIRKFYLTWTWCFHVVSPFNLC